MQPQKDYLLAYRSLRLTRDDNGVLVAEFHSKGESRTRVASFTFPAGRVVRTE